MQLNAVVRAFGSGDQSWLGSKHATDTAQTITLDGGAFSAYADEGVIPSGLAVVKQGEKFVPATKKYDGFIFTSQSFDGKNDVVAPMIDHGRIIVDRLPKQSAKFNDGVNPHFVYVGANGGSTGGGSNGTAPATEGKD